MMCIFNTSKCKLYAATKMHFDILWATKFAQIGKMDTIAETDITCYERLGHQHDFLQWGTEL